MANAYYLAGVHVNTVSIHSHPYAYVSEWVGATKSIHILTSYKYKMTCIAFAVSSLLPLHLPNVFDHNAPFTAEGKTLVQSSAWPGTQ